MLARKYGRLAVCVLLALVAGRESSAGGIHIRYGPDAPERFEARNEVYAQGVLNLDERHHAWFARTHPFYSRMFGDPVMLDKVMARWEAHEQRFEYWHDCLWKTLDGYRAEHLVPPVSGPLGGQGLASLGSVSPQGAPSPFGVPGGMTGPPGGGPITQAAVPEPSSGLMIMIGVAAVAWRLAVCRRDTRGLRA